MFNSILGTVSEIQDDGICLDTGSIEWFILMPSKAIEKMTLDSEIRIYTYLQHHENLMQLFGFSSKNERLLFLDLIKVNGIGPKQAIKILSSVEPPAFVEMLENSDADGLRKIPGIGKVTAQKILLTLKGKLTTEKDFTTTDETFEYADILTALTEMGFDRNASKNAIIKQVKSIKLQDVEINENEILRAAIVSLSSR